MSRSSALTGLAGDERGAVLVIFAVFAPVAVLFAAFALDASNWYLHKRHLQLQADAGALAAALAFQPCSNKAVEASAHKYSGVGEGALYNEQVATKGGSIHELINSKTYYNQAAPVDGSVEEKPPCEALMVDLKLTETNLPWYWEPFTAVEHIDAHARVEILKENTASGVEPLAVSDTAPVAAEAYFVDEDHENAVLAKAKLKKTGVNGEGQDVWSDVSAPAEVTINHPHIGIVVALSGNNGNREPACGEEYVECFGRNGEGTRATSLKAAQPILHIAGYSTAGAGSAESPIARKVTLSPSTCADGYFSNASANCAFTITAAVDWGAVNKEGQKTPKLEAEVAGKKTVLAPKTGTAEWTGTATLPAGTGSNEVNLIYECKLETGSPCTKATAKATFKDVHSIYAASEARTGTIAAAWVGAEGTEASPQDANSFAECSSGCAQKLFVTLDVAGSLAAATGFSDPVRRLKFEGNQGVIVECPPTAGEAASEYREHLAKSCPGTYELNPTLNLTEPNCTGTKEPFDCLKVGVHGKKNGSLSGIAERIESKPGLHFYCPNNWRETNGGGVPIIPLDDSRVVQVFIMPYGSVNVSGQAISASGLVGIQNFAAFYVTGFPGDSCASDPVTGSAEIVGHFIKYVNVAGKEGGGKPKCREDPLGECVAVLTR
jgi:hypothetical protein